MTALGWWEEQGSGRSQWVEGWSKKEKDSWTWTTLRDLWGEEDIGGINGNGKNKK